MPGGEVEVYGERLTDPRQIALPEARIADVAAQPTLSRPTRTVLRVPEGAISGEVTVRHSGLASNGLPLRVAVPMADNVHPVGNPAVDADGNVFATLSGSRGQETPVSIFRIDRDFGMRPFARGILNATGLAFGPDAALYTSSRADGTVYRISPEGSASIYAEGLGLATGLAFDATGNLYVGDRSGTIFRVGPQRGGTDREIFVFATLEPSMAAYHLAFNDAGVLFVTGPTTSSWQCIHAIDPDGSTSVFFQGLGRAQGMAFARDGNLYVAASLAGQRGIVRITPGREASLAVAGDNLVGLAFLEDGCAVLAARDALYHLDLGVEGRRLV